MVVVMLLGIIFLVYMFSFMVSMLVVSSNKVLSSVLLYNFILVVCVFSEWVIFGVNKLIKLIILIVVIEVEIN